MTGPSGDKALEREYLGNSLTGPQGKVFRLLGDAGHREGKG